MRFAASKCKVLLQDCDDHADLVLDNEVIEVVDQFVYLGSCISSGGSIGNEIATRISKARSVFANLGHLWRQRGLSLKLKGRVYKATVRAVILYGCETWPFRIEDLNRLEVFDHRCLRSIARIGWHERVSNAEVRRRIFGPENQASSIGYSLRMHRFRWLGHVLRMPAYRLPHRALFANPATNWRKVQGGQPMTWRREMKKATTKLATVGRVRLPGWGPRDSQNRWLETLGDMATNRVQWRECCRCLAELSVR
jgi:hypothetical protein